MPPRRVFLLSPARTDGERAKLILNPRAAFPLAVTLREGPGAPIGDVFSFLSGLYFRGKVAYVRAFAHPPTGVEPALVITTDRGLVPLDTVITRKDLVAFSKVDIGAQGAKFLRPLRHDAEALAASIGAQASVILLGSIATGKYTDTLIDVFGSRLLFPAEFVGRGDMSRGGLMLRSAREGTELEYVPVAGATVRGRRPARLGG